MTGGFGAGLYAMTLISAIGGLLLLLLGEKKRLSASLRTVISLCLLVMLISPLFSMLESASAWFEALSPTVNSATSVQNAALSGFYEEKSIAYATAATEQALGQYISAKTGVLPQDMLITLQTDARDAEHVTVDAVKVELLLKKDRITGGKIKTFVEELLGCPCTVSVSGTLDAYFEEGGERRS